MRNARGTGQARVLAAGLTVAAANAGCREALGIVDLTKGEGGAGGQTTISTGPGTVKNAFSFGAGQPTGPRAVRLSGATVATMVGVVTGVSSDDCEELGAGDSFDAFLVSFDLEASPLSPCLTGRRVGAQVAQEIGTSLVMVDGDHVIAGTYADSPGTALPCDNSPSASGYGFFVTRLEDDGNCTWTTPAQNAGSGDGSVRVVHVGAAVPDEARILVAYSYRSDVGIALPPPCGPVPPDGNPSASPRVIVAGLHPLTGECLWRVSSVGGLTGLDQKTTGAAPNPARASIYVTGTYFSEVGFENSSCMLTDPKLAGERGAYIAEINSDGVCVGIRNIGVPETPGGGSFAGFIPYDESMFVAVAKDGSPIVAGPFAGNVTIGSESFNSQVSHVYLMKWKVDANGALDSVDWVSQPFVGSVYVTGIATDANDDIILAGSLKGDTSFDGQALPFAGGTDAFVVKLDSAGMPRWGTSFGGAGWEGASGVTVNPEGDIVVVGSHDAAFDIGGISVPAPEGGDGSFLVVLRP